MNHGCSGFYFGAWTSGSCALGLANQGKKAKMLYLFGFGFGIEGSNV